MVRVPCSWFDPSLATAKKAGHAALAVSTKVKMPFTPAVTQ
jgi:hypothetical protein